MLTKIEIGNQPQYEDAFSHSITNDIFDLGFGKMSLVKTFQIFYILGEISDEEIERICQNLLVDQITQVYSINQKLEKGHDGRFWISSD